MTDAQIRYRQLVETTRHNREQEDNWLRSLGETIRHDKEQEQLSKYSADTSAAATQYRADKSAEASKYSADASASTNLRRTELEHLDRTASRELEAYTTRFANEMKALQYKLDKLGTESSVAKNAAQVQQWERDYAVALEQLNQKAKELDLQELRTIVQNELDRARKIQAYTGAGKNVADTAKELKETFAGRVSSIINKLRIAIGGSL